MPRGLTNMGCTPLLLFSKKSTRNVNIHNDSTRNKILKIFWDILKARCIDIPIDTPYM